MPSAWMRTMWVTPRHSRTSRVPGFSEIGGVGLTAPRPNGSALARSSFRAVAMERPPYTGHAAAGPGSSPAAHRAWSDLCGHELAGSRRRSRGARSRLFIGRAEEAEEIRFRADDHACVAAFQSGLIGLHRAVEGKKIGVLAEGVGENAISVRVARASRLVGFAPGVSKRHDDLAVGIGGDGLGQLGALRAILRCLARSLALHPAKHLFGNLPWQIGAADSHIDGRE